MVNEADSAPRGELDYTPEPSKFVEKKPVSYTQNRKKFYQIDGVDTAKPYIVKYDDDSVKVYQGNEAVTERPVTPPPMPTASFGGKYTPVKEPTAPLVTPEAPFEAEAAPRIPSVAPFVSPTIIESTWEGTRDRARASLATTIAGRYTPGQAFDNLFDTVDKTGYGSTTKVAWNGQLENVQGYELLDTVTAGIYESMVEQEPRLRDAFIGAVASSIDGMPQQVKTAFDVSVGRSGGDADLFRLLARYLIDNPDSLTDEVREFYTATGIFKENPTYTPGETSLATNIARRFPFVGEDLAATITSLEGARDIAELAATFTGAIEQQVPNSGRILYPVLQEVITQHIKTYDSAIEAEVTSVANVQRALRANPQVAPDMFAITVDSADIEYARWVYPELASLSTDTMVRALAITPADLGATRNFRPQDISSLTPEKIEAYRRMGMFNDPATTHWLSLGLSPNQIAAMWRLVTVGIQQDIPRFVREIPRAQEEARRKQQEAQQWIRDNGIVNADALSPARFGGLPVETYLSLGVSPNAAENLSSFRPLLSTPATAARAFVSAVGNIGTFVDRTSGAFEFETAEQFYSDPNDTQAFRVQRTFTDFFSLFSQINQGQIPDTAQLEQAGSLRTVDQKWAPGHNPNGPLRHRMTDLWNRVGDQTHWDLARTSSLYRPEQNAAGEWYYPHAEEFLATIETLMASRPDMTLDEAAKEAAASARGADDLLFSMMIDTYNLIDIPGVSALVTQPIRGARYAVTGVDGIKTFEDVALFGPTSPVGRASRRAFQRGHTTVTGTQIADPNVQRLLRERASELDARLLADEVTQVNPDGSIVMRRADGTRQTANQLTQYRREREEIENLLNFSKKAKPTDTLQIKTTIRHPLGMQRGFDVGQGFIDIFTKGRVMNRAMAPYTQATRRMGETVAGLDVPLHRRIAQSIKGGHFRASESGIRAQAAQDVSSSVETLQWAVGRHPLRSQNLSGDALRSTIRTILSEARVAAQEGDLLTFVRNNGLHPHLTEDVYRGLEVLTDIDIDTLAFLADDVKIATDADDYTRLLAEADQIRLRKGDKAGLGALARTFRNETEWAGALYEELAGHIQRTVNNRYGLGENAGLLLAAQNKLNGLLSMFYLESPGYVVRNFASNVTAATVDGFNPFDAVWGNSDARRLLEKVQGSEPLVSGFGVEGRAVVNVADMQAVKARIQGQLRARSWRTRARSTGIPFVTTAFPGISFRELASRDERTRRLHLVINDFYRHFGQYNEGLRTSLANDPALLKLTELNPEFARALVDNLTDLTFNDETVALMRYGDGPMVRVETRQRAQALAQRMGIDITDVDPAIWSAADELLNDPVATPEMITTRVASMRETFDSTARQIAEELGVPPAVANSITELFTDIYRHALAEGLTGQDAGNIGRIISTEIAKAVPYIYQKGEELTQFLTDPQLYKNNIFGTILDGQFVDLNKFKDELVAFGGRTQSMTDFLHSEGAQQTLEALDDLIEEGRQITQVTTGNPVLIQRAANRSAELFEEIKTELINRDALTVVRRATPRRPRQVITRPIHLAPPAEGTLNRTQFFRAKRDLDGAITRFSRIMTGMNENFTKNELFSSAYERIRGNSFIDEAKAELEEVLANMNAAQRKDALARIRREAGDGVGSWQRRKLDLINALEREGSQYADDLAAEAAEAERIAKLGPTASEQRLIDRRNNITTFVESTMDANLPLDTRLDRIIAEYSTLFGADNLMANMNSGLLRMIRGVDPSVTSGQVFGAFQRGVKRGFIKLVPDERGRVIRFVRTGTEGMSNDVLRSKFDELYRGLNTVADAVAANRMQKAKPTIESFLGFVETKTNDLLSNVRRTATSDPTNGILVSLNPPQTALGGTPSPAQQIMDEAAVMGSTSMTKDESHRVSSRFLNYVHEQVREWSDTVQTRYNEVAVPLGLPPSPVGKADEAAVAGRYVGVNAPNALVEFYARNLPYRWLFDDLDSGFKAKAAEQVAMRRRLNNFLYDDTEFMEGIEITLDEAIKFAADPKIIRETPDTIAGLTRPIFARNRAFTAPAGVELGPVLPAMVDGRKASHNAPTGYRTVIVGDKFFGAEARLGRFALHISDEADEEMIREFVQRMANAHSSLRATFPSFPGGAQFPRGFDYLTYVERWAEDFEDQEMAEWVRHYARQINQTKSPNRVLNNPTGFFGAPPVDVGGVRAQAESFTYVQEQLAPYVQKWQETGDVAARETFLGAIYHRLAGWPISGDRRGTRRTFETINEAGEVVEVKGRARTLDDIYNYYRNVFRTSSEGLLSSRAVGVDAATLRDVSATVNRVKKENSVVALYAMRQARARADWVLHNYTATNDIDFLLRWLGPWHIWPTRTAAKIGARLIDDPRWFSAFSQYRNVTADAPPDLPSWASTALDVSFMRGPLGFAFEGLTGADLRLDTNMITFWDGIIQDYEIGEPDQYTGIARFVNAIDNQTPLPINPLYKHALVLSGQFGEVDTADYLEGSFARGTRAILGMADAINLDKILKENFPRDIFMSEKDRNYVSEAYIQMAIEADQEGNTERADEIRESAMMFARNARTTTGSWLTGVTNTEMRADPIYQEALARAYGRNRALPYTSSYFGARISGYQNTRGAINDFFEQAEQIARRGYANEGERRQAIADFWNNSPYAQVYMLTRGNLSADQANIEVADSQWHTGREKIIQEYNAEMASLSPGDTVGQRDVLRRRHEKEVKLATEIFDQTGYNPMKDEEFEFNRTLEPTALDPMGNNVYQQLMDFGARNVTRKDILEDLSPETRLALTGLNWFEELTNFIDSIGLSPREAVAIQNAIRPPVYLDYVSEWVQSELDVNKFKMDAYHGTRLRVPTNAINFEEYMATKDRIYGSMPAELGGFIQQHLRRFHNPQTAVDASILDYVEEQADEVSRIRRDQGLTPDERHIREMELLESYKLPSVDDVYSRFFDQYGEAWFTFNNVDQAEIRRLIQERIRNAENLAHLGIYMDGKWENRAAALERDLINIADAENDEVKGILEGDRSDFVTPSGYVVHDEATLEEFRRALQASELVRNARKHGITGFYLEASLYPEYYWYFVPQGDQIVQLQKTIDEWTGPNASDKQKDYAYQTLIPQRDALIGRDTSEAPRNDEPVADATGTSQSSSRRTSGNAGGVPSVGSDVRRLNSNYRVEYISPATPLSREGMLTRNFLLSKYFTGTREDDAPPDWVFEHLGRNGVAEQAEIKDFFESLLKQFKGPLADVLAKNPTVADALFAIENEEVDEDGVRRVPTWRYIKGIEALLGAMFSIPTGQTGKVSLTGIQPTDAPERTNRPRSALPSNSGPGRLPRWDEAVGHINNLFHDPSLLLGLNDFWTKRKPLSRNHQRMLRFMYRSFPLGLDLTFDEWMSALKLMWQTSAFTGGQNTSVNPAGRQEFDSPRFARFTQN